MSCGRWACREDGVQHAAKPLQGPALQGMSAEAHCLTARLGYEADAGQLDPQALPARQEACRKRSFDQAARRQVDTLVP